MEQGSLNIGTRAELTTELMRPAHAVVVACPRLDPFTPTLDPHRGLRRKAANALLNLFSGNGLRDLPRNRQWD